MQPSPRSTSQLFAAADDKELQKVLKSASRAVSKTLAEAERIHRARLHKIHACHDQG